MVLNNRAIEVEKLIPEMVERIVERCHPLQVVLFGSRARGDALPRSDVDLLVVIPDGEDRRKARDDVNAALRDCHAPNDIIIATPHEIARFGNLVGMVFRPALRDGKVLYDAEMGYIASRWGNGAEPPHPPLGGSVTDADRVAETGRWLHRASRDLEISELHAQGQYAEPNAACYHAQQAAEKALKAALVFLQIPFEKTHNLDELRDLIPAGWPAKREHPQLKRLSDWAVEARYPGPWVDPSEADARNAARQARAVFESVARDLSQHGFDAAGSP